MWLRNFQKVMMMVAPVVAQPARAAEAAVEVEAQEAAEAAVEAAVQPWPAVG